MNRPATFHTPFETWDLDLLVDYIQKYHHRNIRRNGVELYHLLLKVAASHPELNSVTDHFRNSLQDLDTHCIKEDNVLYPYVVELFQASERSQTIQPFHCGTVQSPIQAMMMDHDDEMSRHARIAELTNDYTAPEGADEDYQKALAGLRHFRDELLEHIWVENEIVFPRALQLEATNVAR